MKLRNWLVTGAVGAVTTLSGVGLAHATPTTGGYTPTATAAASCLDSSTITVKVDGSGFPAGTRVNELLTAGTVSKYGHPAADKDGGLNDSVTLAGVAETGTGTVDITPVTSPFKPVTASFSWDCSPQPTPVTPKAPWAKGGVCKTPVMTVHVPRQEGVVYTPSGNQTLQPGQSVTVTAAPAEGFVFTAGAVTSWSFTNDLDLSGCSSTSPTAPWSSSSHNPPSSSHNGGGGTQPGGNGSASSGYSPGHAGAGDSSAAPVVGTLFVVVMTAFGTLFWYRRREAHSH